MLIGHEVVIDNKEGNAINFTNYIAVALFLLLALIKLPKLKARWLEIWPFFALIGIYIINSIFAPYPNASWVIYQLVL